MTLQALVVVTGVNASLHSGEPWNIYVFIFALIALTLEDRRLTRREEADRVEYERLKQDDQPEQPNEDWPGWP